MFINRMIATLKVLFCLGLDKRVYKLAKMNLPNEKHEQKSRVVANILIANAYNVRI